MPHAARDMTPAEHSCLGQREPIQEECLSTLVSILGKFLLTHHHAMNTVCTHLVQTAERPFRRAEFTHMIGSVLTFDMRSLPTAHGPITIWYLFRNSPRPPHNRMQRSW